MGTEKSVRVEIRSGNGWKIDRVIRSREDAERAFDDAEARLVSLQSYGSVICKIGGRQRQCGYRLGEDVRRAIDEFMTEQGLFPAEEDAFMEPPAKVKSVAGTGEEYHELSKEELALLEAERMHEIACGLWDGLTHVRTVCDLLKQATLRARDVFGDTHAAAPAMLELVLDAEDALQSMLQRLINDSDDLADRLEAVVNPCDNTPSQTSDQRSA